MLFDKMFNCRDGGVVISTANYYFRPGNIVAVIVKFYVKGSLSFLSHFPIKISYSDSFESSAMFSIVPNLLLIAVLKAAAS